MDSQEMTTLLQRVEACRGKRSQILRDLKIPRSTYYGWRKTFREKGIKGLRKKKDYSVRIWNRLMPGEKERVLEIARLHPELSARLLSVKIIDEEDFSISESTVYRILKENHLIT